MASAKEEKLAKDIYSQVGGMSNVGNVINCMTRVRLDIKDYNQVDIDNLKKVDGVLGVVEDDTLQIVLGPGIVTKVANQMSQMKKGRPAEVDTTDVPSGRQEAERKAAATKSEQKNAIILHSSVL